MKGRGMSFAQRRYLMHIYITQGYAAAKPIAIKYGIQPRTMSNYARAMGVQGRPGREPELWKGRTPNFHSMKKFKQLAQALEELYG